METLPRREKERQARQAEIVAAAEKIFCRRDYADASMDEIAKEAQFTKRTVYQYFTNKEDLYCAVALEGNKRFFARQQAAMAGGVLGWRGSAGSRRGLTSSTAIFPNSFA